MVKAFNCQSYMEKNVSTSAPIIIQIYVDLFPDTVWTYCKWTECLKFITCTMKKQKKILLWTLQCYNPIHLQYTRNLKTCVTIKVISCTTLVVTVFSLCPQTSSSSCRLQVNIWHLNISCTSSIPICPNVLCLYIYMRIALH